MGGAAVHPGWYHNLKADPCANVQHRGGIEQRIAREASGAERDQLYATMGVTFSNFLAYQARATNRRIPVMVLSKAQ
jgi:deazaflavin-dependent oxidoreductase (nitroreductase family)